MKPETPAQRAAAAFTGFFFAACVAVGIEPPAPLPEPQGFPDAATVEIPGVGVYDFLREGEGVLAVFAPFDNLSIRGLRQIRAGRTTSVRLDGPYSVAQFALAAVEDLVAARIPAPDVLFRLSGATHGMGATELFAASIFGEANRSHVAEATAEVFARAVAPERLPEADLAAVKRQLFARAVAPERLPEADLAAVKRQLFAAYHDKKDPAKYVRMREHHGARLHGDDWAEVSLFCATLQNGETPPGFPEIERKGKRLGDKRLGRILRQLREAHLADDPGAFPALVESLSLRLGQEDWDIVGAFADALPGALRAAAEPAPAPTGHS